MLRNILFLGKYLDFLLYSLAAYAKCSKEWLGPLEDFVLHGGIFPIGLAGATLIEGAADEEMKCAEVGDDDWVGCGF